MACLGELKIYFCITQNITFLNMFRVCAWTTTQCSSDGRTFNETIDLPLPYKSLYNYNGVCFVLCSTCTHKDGVQEQLLAASNLKLYNTKNLFRNGLYEIELHPLVNYSKIKRLEDVEVLVRDYNFDSKPKEMYMMNKLLKIHRKRMRNELYETPLDRHVPSDIEHYINDAKMHSGRLFLSVRFDFCRAFPHINMPDPSSFVRAEKWNPVDEMYFKLTRNARTADIDRDRKPNKEALNLLKASRVGPAPGQRSF
ncbi:unnamed protein product [Protopolystoma xenopodis]|uniref:C2 PI3K-type domain-containing protein n=1 Tax=Protopolystoma xenopodis TaxID=117903 RepID=A0A3S5AQA9_9PLAT|nr:unnamed protein product [Protopolystoma xenopodis]